MAFVAISGLDFADAIADGLRAQGATVAIIGDAQADGFASRAAVEAAFRAASERIGAPDLVVHAAAPRAAQQPALLSEIDLAGFEAACDAGLRATLYTLQAAHACMARSSAGNPAGKGGSIAVLGPALSLVGAARLVALGTCSEGQRSLMKSAARQWGTQGIRLNWVGIANALYAPGIEACAPQVPELGPPPCALGEAPALATAVAAVLAFLGSAAGGSLTGASLNLDGGDWMTP